MTHLSETRLVMTGRDVTLIELAIEMAIPSAIGRTRHDLKDLQMRIKELKKGEPIDEEDQLDACQEQVGRS
jgi:hypothetical protein